MAQSYNGVVKSNKDKKPLDMVSIVAYDSINNPIAFDRTNEKGMFVLKIPENSSVNYLTFSSLGYATIRTDIHNFENGKTIFMKQEATNLREVVIKSNRLQGRGDTLVYSVAGFMQKQDRSIADVIAKMPGMEVSENGQIKYQGKPINKFYIEGMDLMGSKYSMASTNLAATKVKNVQVLKNHQPIKALKGVKFSDEAALNLELAEDAKNVWNGSAEIGAGMQLQEGDGQNLLRDGRLMAMNFSKKAQNISMYKWNNTGKNIHDEISDLTSESGFTDKMNSWLNDIQIAAPNIKAQRFHCNDTRILATNWLRKLNNNKSIRFQSTYLFDKTIGYQYSQTIYNNIPGGVMIEQESDANLFRREGTINLQYKLNSDKLYVNNVIKGEINWNQSDANSYLNGNRTHQMVQPRKRMLSDDFKFIKNINKHQSININALASYQYLPGLMALGDSLNEQINLTAKSLKAGTGFRHKVLGFNISYNATVNYNRQEAEILLRNYSNAFQERIEGTFTPSVSYRKRKITLSSSLPIILANYKMNDDKHSYFHVDPQLSLNYKLNSMIDINFEYYRQKNPLQFKNICPISYYTSYINYKEGNGLLTEITNNNIESILRYENPLMGIFFHISGIYQGTANMPLTSSTLDGSVYKTIMTHQKYNQESYEVEGELSQTFSLGKMSISIGGSSLWNKYQQLINNERNRCVTNMTELYANLAFMPIPIFSIEENSTCYISHQKNNTHSELSANRLKSFEHQIKLFLMPNRWQIEWAHELYHSNDKSVSTNYFSDIKIAYRKKKHEMSITINNIFGTTSYNREIITDNYRQYSINHLRPREIIAKMAFYL